MWFYLRHELDVQVLEGFVAFKAHRLDVKPGLEQWQAARHAHERHVLMHRQQRHLPPSQQH